MTVCARPRPPRPPRPPPRARARSPRQRATHPVVRARAPRLPSRPRLLADWALCAPNDAIPHLPFRSWGFRHPAGSLLLAPSAPATARRDSDPGDSVEFLRPREGELWNWVTCHDLNEYVQLLERLPANYGAPPPPATAADAADTQWGI